MSKQQYDLSKQTNYLKRHMFLDPEGPVTVQRFEEVKYPRIAKIEELLACSSFNNKNINIIIVPLV